MIPVHNVHLWHRVVVPRIGDLVLLKLPAGSHLVGDITDSDGGDHISAEKVQPRQEHAAHIADRQNMDTLFALFRLISQDLFKFRMGRIHRPKRSGIELREELRREFPDLSVVCGRI